MIIETMWHYEFHQFDTDNQENITNFDLALALYVYYIPFQKIPEYLLHLDKFQDNKKGCCDVTQYIAFQYLMRSKARIIQTVMDKGRIDFDGLRELCDEFEQEDPFCKRTGTHISDDLL